MAELTTIAGVSAEIARLEGLLAIGTITEAREVAIRTEKAEYAKILAILLQQSAAQQCKELLNS